MQKKPQVLKQAKKQQGICKTQPNEEKDENEEETLALKQQQQQQQRKVNPTYKSQIFCENDSNDVRQFRDPTGKQILKDQSYSDIFGVVEKIKEIKTTTAGLSSQANNQHSVADCLGSNQAQVGQLPKQAAGDFKRQKDKSIPFNAMWWDSSSVPNNDPSTLTQDYAKQRKLNDYLVNNVFDNQPTEAVKKAVQACSNNKSNPNHGDNQELNIPAGQRGQENNKSTNFNIISHTSEQNSRNKGSDKITSEKEKMEVSRLTELEEQQRKANRNYSNLFGRAQTANSNKGSNQDFIENKSELFLPANANIDKFDSKRYNPRTDQENIDMNAVQRHFKNLQSVLDTHDHQAEFKRGQLINNKGAIKTDEPPLVIENISELIKDKSVIPKKSFMRIGEAEKMILLEIKSLKAHFDKEAFKRFCLQKGYRIIVFSAGQNGRGEVFLKESRKNPDPIESISAHLKIHGAGISANKVISGKEFNAKNFEAIPKAKKNAQSIRPSTGKKHFTSNQQSGHLQNVI